MRLLAACPCAQQGRAAVLRPDREVYQMPAGAPGAGSGGRGAPQDVGADPISTPQSPAPSPLALQRGTQRLWPGWAHLGTCPNKPKQSGQLAWEGTGLGLGVSWGHLCLGSSKASSKCSFPQGMPAEFLPAAMIAMIIKPVVGEAERRAGSQARPQSTAHLIESQIISPDGKGLPPPSSLGNKKSKGRAADANVRGAAQGGTAGSLRPGSTTPRPQRLNLASPSSTPKSSGCQGNAGKGVLTSTDHNPRVVEACEKPGTWEMGDAASSQLPPAHLTAGEHASLRLLGRSAQHPDSQPPSFTLPANTLGSCTKSVHQW